MAPVRPEFPNDDCCPQTWKTCQVHQPNEYAATPRRIRPGSMKKRNGRNRNDENSDETVPREMRKFVAARRTPPVPWNDQSRCAGISMIRAWRIRAL